MLRRIIIVASTSLAVATTYLWAASYSVPRLLGPQGSLGIGGYAIGRDWSIWCEGGLVRAQASHRAKNLRSTRVKTDGSFSSGKSVVDFWSWGSFVYFAVHDASNRRIVAQMVHIPIWAPVAAFSLYPVLALITFPARRRRRRKRLGLCIACGYDLTGNTSGICPECGSKIGKTR